VAITTSCGPHCGIRANAENTLTREGHCDCDELCHAGSAPAVTVSAIRGQDRASGPADLDGRPLTGTPMCARWYEQAGDYRPWKPPHLVIRDDAMVPDRWQGAEPGGAETWSP
jgi:hypothetical protein